MESVTLPKTITNYLDSLCPDGQERLMTTPLIPGTFYTVSDSIAVGCLIGVAEGMTDVAKAVAAEWAMNESETPVLRYLSQVTPGRLTPHHAHILTSEDNYWSAIWESFDNLCGRHGEGRVQQAIRDYIVELRLTRGGTVPEPAMNQPLTGACA